MERNWTTVVGALHFPINHGHFKIDRCALMLQEKIYPLFVLEVFLHDKEHPSDVP